MREQSASPLGPPALDRTKTVVLQSASRSELSSSSSSSFSSPPSPPLSRAFQAPDTVEDDLKVLEMLNDDLDTRKERVRQLQPATKRAKATGKRKKDAADDVPDLTPLELKVADWCAAAGIPFRAVLSEDNRVTELHKENVANYIDSFAEQALRNIQEEREAGPGHSWGWILDFKMSNAVFPAHRAYVAAKRACIQFDLNADRKMQNKRRREELVLRTRQTQADWLKAMRLLS